MKTLAGLRAKAHALHDGLIQKILDMAGALAKGDRVEIRGFCSFFVKEYRAYTGRNPKTGDLVKIDPKKLPYFKAEKEMVLQ